MNLVKCTGTLTINGILISFNVTLLSTVYRNIEMTDWHWQLIVYLPSNQETVSFN